MHALRARVLASFIAIAGLACGPASAAELGFYVGFLYGDSSKEYNLRQFDSLATQIYGDLAYVPDTRAFSTEEDGKSYGFLAGYRLTQHLAFEGGYLYLGKQTYREQSSGFFIPSDETQPPGAEDWTLSLTSRTSGFTVSALGILPINYSWELYARAGVLIGSNTLSLYANTNLFPSPLRDRFTESSTDWLAGAGISMSLAEVYAIRAEFTRIFDAGEAVFGEADVDLITVGLTVAF